MTLKWQRHPHIAAPMKHFRTNLIGGWSVCAWCLIESLYLPQSLGHCFIFKAWAKKIRLFKLSAGCFSFFLPFFFFFLFPPLSLPLQISILAQLTNLLIPSQVHTCKTPMKESKCGRKETTLLISSSTTIFLLLSLYLAKFYACVYFPAMWQDVALIHQLHCEFGPIPISYQWPLLYSRDGIEW